MEDDERAQIMINTKNVDSLNCAKGIACIFCNTDSLYFSWHSRGDASSNSKICGSIVFYSHRLLPVRFTWKGN